MSGRSPYVSLRTASFDDGDRGSQLVKTYVTAMLSFHELGVKYLLQWLLFCNFKLLPIQPST